MTMQQTHSPKPEVFGEGYGAHLVYNLRLVKLFFKLALQVFINAFVPGLYYEQAHWKVIEAYHKMRGLRHGTISDHRCPECGGELFSADEMHLERDHLKQLECRMHIADECNKALDEMHELEEQFTPEVEELVNKRIKEIESGEVETIDWRDLEKK